MTHPAFAVSDSAAPGSAASVPALRLRGLTKRYAPGLPPVVSGLDLDVQPGELVTLLGPSGCGKTTTLRLIAGLETPDSGAVEVGGQPVTALPPERRGVGLVFQDYALFPHLSVLGNVMFGLHGQRGARERAREILALVGLTVFEDRRPHQLSGGQQQRVALARALAARPRLLLLDEPFSNLDAVLRQSTRAEVRAILRRTGMTALLVTHDQEEALAFSDRLVLMRAGQVEQLGTPAEVYAAPQTAFVANFLGRANLLSGLAEGDTAQTLLGRVNLTHPACGAAVVCLRPEQLGLGPALSAPVSGTVLSREFGGAAVTYAVRVGEGTQAKDLLVRETVGGPLWAEGERVGVQVRGSGHPLP